MKFHHLRPMLWTLEMDATIAFYTEILGFTCVEKNDDWGWASLHRDEVEIMLTRPNEHTPFQKPMFTGSFYIRVDNADDLWKQIKDKVKICYEIEDFDWEMREFGIYDNNGYLIQIGHPLNEGN